MFSLIYLRGRELLPPGSVSKCPQWLGLGQSQELGTQSRSLIWVAGTQHHFLPRSILAGIWSQDPGIESKHSGGILTPILTTKPKVHPWSRHFNPLCGSQTKAGVNPCGKMAVTCLYITNIMVIVFLSFYKLICYILPETLKDPTTS